MKKLTMSIVALLMLLLLADRAVPEKLEPAALNAAGKAATALVEVGDKKSSGTAFCVDESGLFLTNAHVVDKIAKNGTARLVLQPGETTQQVLSAEVLMIDSDMDLALLRVKEKATLSALKFGDSDTLVETQQIYAFGFPFGMALSFEESKFPAITVNIGHVTALRKKDGVLELIQVDADVNPGNSGGPVLDESGNVIGVVQAGVVGTNVNFVIPVAKVRKFLAKVIIVLTEPALTADMLDKPVKFETSVVDFQPAPDKPLEVELTIEPAGMERTTTAMTGDGKNFSAEVVMVPKKEGPENLRATAEFPQGGRMEGMLEPVTFKSGEEEITFDSVSEVTGGPQPKITLRSGGAKKDIAPDTKLTLVVGPHKIEITVAAVESVRIAPPARLPGSINYVIIATRDGQEVGRSEGVIGVAGVAAASGSGGEAGNITAAQFDGDKVTKKCPEVIGDIIDGGNGKYLICYFPKLRKLGIFDVATLDFVHYISVNDDAVKFAAGRSKLIVVLPGSGVIQRYDLETRDKELTLMVPLKGQVNAMVMGSNSEGPVFMTGEVGSAFVDIATLKPIEVKSGKGDRGMSASGERGVKIRASADGTVFGLWNTSVSPQGVSVRVCENGAVKEYYQHNSEGAVLPSPDGKYIFTGANVYTRELKVVRNAQNETFVPARQGEYYLGIYRGSDNKPNPQGNVTVYSTSNNSAIFTLSVPEAASEYGEFNKAVLTPDKRIWCFPLAKALIALALTNDQFVVYRFDAELALEKAGIDYLFVNSTPPASVKPGESFKYQVSVKSKKGGVKFKLEGAPDGMQISPDGLITWQVPTDIAEAKVTIILSITDDSGQEVYHNFELAVMKP